MSFARDKNVFGFYVMFAGGLGFDSVVQKVIGAGDIGGVFG